MEWNASEHDSWLTRASLAYLALSVLLFLSFWLKPVFAVPALLATLAGIVGLWRTYPVREEGTKQKTWLPCAAVALIATAL